MSQHSPSDVYNEDEVVDDDAVDALEADEADRLEQSIPVPDEGEDDYAE